MSDSSVEMHDNRKLSFAYPDLERLANERFSHIPMGVEGVEDTMLYLNRIVDLPDENKSVIVIGCGPQPYSLRRLLELGYDATGVEPVPGFVENAATFLGETGRVALGEAENLPYGDESVGVVLLESVLDHVDSPTKALDEAFRVLMPGGVLVVETTNRFRFHPLGVNGEYQIPFFNYFPKTLKEALVHHHLHYNPTLANYSTRPAVHWFSYADLCALGRQVGFYRFYPRFDGMRPTDPALAGARLRRLMLDKIQRSPIFRTLALLQFGGGIFMLKREERQST